MSDPISSKRLRVNLGPEALEFIEKIEDSRKASHADLTRRALALEQFIREGQSDGAEILVQRADESTVRVTGTGTGTG